MRVRLVLLTLLGYYVFRPVKSQNKTPVDSFRDILHGVFSISNLSTVLNGVTDVVVLLIGGNHLLFSCGREFPLCCYDVLYYVSLRTPYVFFVFCFFLFTYIKFTICIFIQRRSPRASFLIM